jgi:hypothetical protein
MNVQNTQWGEGSLLTNILSIRAKERMTQEQERSEWSSFKKLIKNPTRPDAAVINPPADKTWSTSLGRRVIHNILNSGVAPRTSPKEDANAVARSNDAAIEPNPNRLPVSEIISLLNLKKVECGGGGHCLLHSVIHQTKDQEAHEGQIDDVHALRQLILDGLDEDIAKLNERQSNGEDVKLLLEKSKKLRENSVDSKALYDDVTYYIAKYYGRNIFVITDKNVTDSNMIICHYYSHNMSNISDIDSLTGKELLEKRELLDGAIGIFHKTGHYQALVRA